MSDRKEYQRKYRQANKEYHREYQLKNKEKIKEYQRKYRLSNKDKQQEYQQEYQRQYRQAELGKKRNRISMWKFKGIIDNYNDNYETIYRLYSIQKMCSICHKLFNNEKRMNFKCVDHCHQTGKMRRICCIYCNRHIVK